MKKKENAFQTNLKNKKIFVPILINIFFSLFLLLTYNILLYEFIIQNIFFIIIWWLISTNIINLISKKSLNETPIIKRLFTMIILSFLIGWFFKLISLSDPFVVKLKINFLAFLPCIICISLLLFLIKYNSNKKLEIIINIVTILMLFLAMAYYGFVLLFGAIDEVRNPVTDVRYYHKYVNKSLLTTFPKKIPSNVEKVSFIYSPGILQGGTEISLYYIDKNMTVDKMNRNYKKKAIWIGQIDNYKEKRGLLTGAFSNTPAEYKNEDDYTIYLTKGRCDNSGWCNHGSFLLVAFNENTKEVIYKFEEW